MLHPSDFFELNNKEIAHLFNGCYYVWQVFDKIDHQISRLIGSKQTILGEVMTGAHLSDQPIYIGEGARVEPGAFILGPAYIGPGTIIRHGAYVRENVIMFAESVLGHASEVKNSIFLPKAHAPHFNYVGDSVLGHRVNLGAGTKLSNLTILSEKDPVTEKRPTIEIQIDTERFDTGLTKLGAILGDDVQTGCNSVLNPGCLVGPRSLIYANLSLRKGYHPPDSIFKLRQKVSRVPMV